MDDFYPHVLGQLLADGTLDRRMRVLVVCGGVRDRDAFDHHGFRDVVISNVDRDRPAEDSAPFEWSYQNAEQLTFEDESFDFSVVHEGLHHCHSPHRALLEMYRVARRGVLLFEPCDNLATRLGVRLGVGQEYEHAAVFYNGCERGGVGNGPIPNYVMRWTEREIIKTINSFAPYGEHRFRFSYRMVMPWTQLRGNRNRARYYAIRAFTPLIMLVSRVLPRQSNNLAAIVLKPQPAGLHPWLRFDNSAIALDRRWLERRYPHAAERPSSKSSPP